MARVSFSLRSTGTDKGSYLRFPDTYPAVTRTNIDSALRSDGFQLAPTSTTASTFSATSVCYGEMMLDWQVPINATLSATPTVTGIVLVYSPDGPPQTIASGTILVEASDQFDYVHTGLTEGRWAYYTLFLHYQDNTGSSYYEIGASLSEIVPQYYGSIFQLWERVPLFYRTQDTAAGDLDWEAACFGNALPAGTLVGPLLKFMSVFGFEMDRMRTLLDYQMVALDPALANAEHLDALSQQLGVGLLSSAMGAARLRTLLNDIGTFRRSKGTPSGTQFFGQAISGSEFTINQATGQITVYSQRVNYITTPKNGVGITTQRAALNTEAVTPLPFSSTAASAGSTSYSVSTNVYTTTGTGASIGIQHVLLHLSSPVRVQLGDFVGFSVQSNVGTSAIKWARLVNAAGSTMGIDTAPISVSGSRVFEIGIASNASSGVWTDGYVEYLVDLSAVSSFVNGSLLAERNFVGSYFDGDTVRGGWLIDATSISDYRWRGSKDASMSLYAEDYQRTNGVVGKLLFDQLPITEVSKYTIVAYNGVPGY